MVRATLYLKSAKTNRRCKIYLKREKDGFLSWKKDTSPQNGSLKIGGLSGEWRYIAFSRLIALDNHAFPITFLADVPKDFQECGSEYKGEGSILFAGTLYEKEKVNWRILGIVCV